MRKIIFTLCVLFCSNGWAKGNGLSSSAYQGLVEALLSGKAVATVVDLSQCAVDGKKVSESAQKANELGTLGGMRITSFLMPKQEYIAFSDVHESYRNAQRTKEYIRYRVKPDGIVTIDITVLEQEKYSVLMQKTYTCSMNRDIRFIW